MTDHVFISFAPADIAFVKELRDAFRGHRSVLSDSEWVTHVGLDETVIRRAIEDAGAFIAVLSLATVNAPNVVKEIRMAEAAARSRRRLTNPPVIVALLLPGVGRSARDLWFDEQTIVTVVELSSGDLRQGVSAILDALGEGPVADSTKSEIVPPPFHELVLRLTDPRLVLVDGTKRASATAQLFYRPGSPDVPPRECRRYSFVAPLGPLDAAELRWYLERSHEWPTEILRTRAAAVEASLSTWGTALYDAAVSIEASEIVALATTEDSAHADRCLSILVDDRLQEGSTEAEEREAKEAAVALLSLPWELLHDGREFVVKEPARMLVRRCLPSRPWPMPARADLPIRILLVSPRPEESDLRYIDHRVAAKPLVEAVERLGGLAEVTVLTPPTFEALEDTLQGANREDRPYSVVHFDGHGAYNPVEKTAVLYFEDPRDVQRLTRRGAAPVRASTLSHLVGECRVPLMFLEACQSAQPGEAPQTDSIAAALLRGGVTSTVAMTHSVLVETASRFVGAFYQGLASGRRIGASVLAARQTLCKDSFRGKSIGANDLHLQDWFVPVLYQERTDLQLITRRTAADVARQNLRESLGNLPEPPAHAFVGRSHELLALERMLVETPCVVIQGLGGIGKTTVAVELARWLVRTRRFQRAAFVSFQEHTRVNEAVVELARQLSDDDRVARMLGDLEISHVDSVLSEYFNSRIGTTPTVIVLDNLEHVLPHRRKAMEFEILFKSLLAASPARLVLTTRSPLPESWMDRSRVVSLGPLTREDAVALVGEVMKREGPSPRDGDTQREEGAIETLVDAVGRHARALVLLAREVTKAGVRATTEQLQDVMVQMNQEFPGDPSRSLFASMELSLRRLRVDTRRQANALAPFHRGASLPVLGQMLEADADQTQAFVRELVEVGLAEEVMDFHLWLDPALSAYLKSEMPDEVLRDWTERWAEAMKMLAAYTLQHRQRDPVLAAQITKLELPNFMALLDWLKENGPKEDAVEWAQRIEQLLSPLDHREALEAAARVRETAASQLTDWSRVLCRSESAEVERLLTRGDLNDAYLNAQRLLTRCLRYGEQAYDGAAYDIAMAQMQLGRILTTSGLAADALPLLGEATARFERLATGDNDSAHRMASMALHTRADCLVRLGDLKGAEETYRRVLAINERLDDTRSAAVNRTQLASVLTRNGQFEEAARIYQQALAEFEHIGEPASLAAVLHQLGSTLVHLKQHERAEEAYRRALTLSEGIGDVTGEARTLSQLGMLYARLGRIEDAVRFYEQAVSRQGQQGDLQGEGRTRNNLAIALMQAGRYDDARRALQRAIECKETFGNAAQPWTSWGLLHTLNQATGNQEGAERAWHQAFDRYLSYRRAGGHGQQPALGMCDAIAEALAEETPWSAERRLAAYEEEAGSDPWVKTLLRKLRDVANGARDLSLARDPSLDYDDAVELHLLIERLGTNESTSETPKAQH